MVGHADHRQEDTNITYARVTIALIRLMRPRQWIKNGFVLAPFLFTGHFGDTTALGASLLAVLLFSIAASSVYVVNDICDVERDRRHPVKRHCRPLAAGELHVRHALALLTMLYALLLAGFLWSPATLAVIAAYLLINLAYTLRLKEVPVLDIFTVAIGYVLRVVVGATAMAVSVSSWMFVTTLCLALYLATIKRRQELIDSGDEGRDALKHYSLPLIDHYAQLSATGALVFYGLFVMTTRPELMITVPLVLFGLFRYQFIVMANGAGESPTDALLRDWPLLVTVLLWIAACAWSLWPAGG